MVVNQKEVKTVIILTNNAPFDVTSVLIWKHVFQKNWAFLLELTQPSTHMDSREEEQDVAVAATTSLSLFLSVSRKAQSFGHHLFIYLHP